LVSNLTAISMKQEIFDLPRKTRRDWLIGSLGYRLFP
jgi:hypothetical protein